MSWTSVALPAVTAVPGANDRLTELISNSPALPAWSTYVAVAFGGLAGAAFAARRGFDLIGVLGLAVAQGIGGLLLADILLQAGTPEVLTDGRYLLIVTLAGFVGFFFAGLIARAVQSAVLLDALSLGLLCAVGTNTALRVGLDNIPAIFIGVMTAVGGLILRDILAGRAPEVLRPGIFIAFAALIGATLFVVLVDMGLTRTFAQLATLVVVAALRVLSVRYHWATREPKDLSDRVWRKWGRKDRPTDALDPVTGYQDRIN